MKVFFVLLLLLAAPVAAHTIKEETQAGAFSMRLSTLPERLEVGATTLVLVVTQDGVAVPNKQVWVRLSDSKKVYVASNFITDEAGTIALSYYFNGPGTYAVTAEIDGSRGEVPIHVHGQYVLLFGFLAAMFITIALLFDNKSTSTKGF